MWISFCLSVAFFHLALAVCPGDWLNITTNDSISNQACFKIFSTQRRSFSSAAAFCQNRGGYLARDTSSTVHSALQQALQDAIKSDTHPENFWIGLTDNNGTGGPWRWLGGNVLGAYTNFRNPNVTNTPNVADCVFISSRSVNFKWYVTTSCDNSTYSLICQRDINAPPISIATQRPVHCPAGYTGYVNLQTCLKLYTTPQSWPDARKTCQASGGDLVKIVNHYLNADVNALIMTQKSIYWIGLNDRANEGLFVWLNETVKANFTNWDTNMPDNEGGNENCVAINGNNNFKWDDGECGILNRFICQRIPLAGTVAPTVVTTASSTNCDSGWISVNNSDKCVQFNTDVLSWMDARLNCLSAGGDLASISSGPEQIFLVSISHLLTSDYFWIGANDRSTANGWHWVDGSPFAFLNWNEQQPDDSFGGSCVGFTGKFGHWDAMSCQNRHGYMCMKKGKVTLPSLITTPTTPTKLPGDVVFGCPAGSYSFRSSCYMAASSSAGVDWTTANSSCGSSLLQGSLAAIVDNDENDFITSILPSNYTDFVWIGLQDPLENTFTWVDGTPVQYTNWKTGEPYNVDSYDCVKMSASNGKWAVEECGRMLQMYICKRNMYILEYADSNQNPGCPNGSLGHGTQCYNFISTGKSFSDAESDCKARSSNYGNLVTIYSEHVQDFLTAQLSTLPVKAYWIGLGQTGPTYSWQSHWPIVSLTYWGKNHTGNEQSTCVALVQDGTTAVWVNYPCSNVMPYICESTRSGYSTQASVTAVTIQLPCPAGWQGYGNNCYKLFGTGLNQLVWRSALSSCANQATGGSLVTITSSDMQNWLFQNITSSFPTVGTVWIGLNDRDTEGGYVWADNSPFLYSKWALNEPDNNLDREDCVAWVIKPNLWNDDYCYKPYSYICQVPRGSVIATAHPPPTGYITPQCGDSSWIMYNSNCYYMGPAFGVGELVTWFEARQNCLDMSADLVSINSEGENGFLTMMASKIATNNFWTGLSDLDVETFGWSDLSPLNYVSWNLNEPNDAYGEEKCVEINSQGLWNNAQCQQKFGYFCKKRPGNFSPIPVSPTSTTGGCPLHFVSLPSLSYCYFVGGTTNSTSQNYEGAIKQCQLMDHKSQLASIHTKLEEKFILVLASGMRSPAWIGLNDRHVRNHFEYVDNSDVSYTNWAPGQPNENLNDNSPDARQDCVYFQVRRNPGTWGDRNCNSTLAFICQSKKEATLPTSAPNTTGCHQGYQRFSNSCYKFFEDPLNWTSAESTCQKDGGNLATLNSGIEQAFVEVVVQGVKTDITQIWIGLKFNIAMAAFTWADGWPVRYTNWGDNEPDMKNNGYCVTHTIDDQWHVSPCVMELSYVCEINFGSPPPPRTSSSTGRCPDNTWSRHNGYCYHIETSNPSTWGEANAACRLLGANLTSIHTDAESRYLTNLIGSILTDVWIGLFKGLNAGFTWYDGTETEYTYWAVGEPNDPDPYLHQDCVKILGRYGTWADTDCTDKNAYICKMAQRSRPSLGPNATYPTRRPTGNRSRPGSRPSLGPNATYPSRRTRHNQSRSPSPAVALGQGGAGASGLGGGGVAGVIIGVLFLVLLCVAIGVVLFRYKQGKTLLPFSAQKLQSALPGVSNVSYNSKRDDKVSLSSDA